MPINTNGAASAIQAIERSAAVSGTSAVRAE